ncbi:MAG: hypothetical protein M3282_10660 [Gemmatimonadota bacterium]|nr:hypothetical protein [Gemmatimonadota bacterium]
MKPRHGHRRSYRGLAAQLAVVGLQISCGGGTEPRGEGSYSAHVTGAVTASIEGIAAFTTSSDGWSLAMLPHRPGEGWSIFLLVPGRRPEAGATIAIRSLDPSQPSPSAHATGDVMHDLGGGLFHFWFASSGEIRILASSTSRVSGSFELTGEPFPADESGSITVTGTFDAVYMERPLFPGVAAKSAPGRARSLVNDATSPRSRLIKANLDGG